MPKTQLGRVVYSRKTHFWSLSDLRRLLRHFLAYDRQWWINNVDRPRAEELWSLCLRLMDRILWGLAATEALILYGALVDMWRVFRNWVSPPPP